MAKKPALGRGLSELLGEVEQSYKNSMGTSESPNSVVELDIEQIIPNPYQPRKNFDIASIQELADSIKEYGLLQPILVYEDGNHYVLIAGERRLRASRLNGNKTLKAIIADVDLSKLREVALIENIQREDLNPIDLACAYDELIVAHGLTHEELAERLQKSRVQITNTLRLLNLSKNIQNLIIEGKITQGHAKILVALEKREQEKIAHTIVGQKLSVRETEDLVRKIKNPPENKNHQSCLTQVFLDKKSEMEIKNKLQQHKINFSFKNNGATLSISLKNQEEIDRFLSLIAK